MSKESISLISGTRFEVKVVLTLHVYEASPETALYLVEAAMEKAGNYMSAHSNVEHANMVLDKDSWKELPR